MDTNLTWMLGSQVARHKHGKHKHGKRNHAPWLKPKACQHNGLVSTKLCNMVSFPMNCSWRPWSLLCNNGLVKIPSHYLIDCQNVQFAWTKMFKRVKIIWNNINIQPYIWTQLLFVEPIFLHGVSFNSNHDYTTWF